MWSLSAGHALSQDQAKTSLYLASPGGIVAVSAAFASAGAESRDFSCRSSVVEHLIGNEEVECSIHSGSTSLTC